MTAPISFTLPNYDVGEIKVFPLTVNPPKGEEAQEPWYTRLADLSQGRDQPRPPTVGERNEGMDLIFKSKNQYYLLPRTHKNFNMAVSYLIDHLTEDGSAQYYYINPTYALVQQMSLKSEVRVQDPVRRKPYQPGWILTGAPSMGAGMTLAPMASAGLVAAGAPSVLNAPLIFPVLAGMFTYVLTYASNWVAYRLTHKGAAPGREVSRKIHNESMLRSGQISVGFFLCEATRVTFEKACESVLEEAWGGAVKVGSTLCPAEIKAAVMVSVGLAVGIGGTLAFGAWQYWNDRKTGLPFDWTLLPVVFLTGFTAGAVSTIEFNNKGFSFLATWAALCLFPIYNAARSEGRKELKNSCAETKSCFIYAAHAIRGKSTEGDYYPSLRSEDPSSDSASASISV